MTALRKTPVAPLTSAAPCTIRAERASDVAEREALLDACFGEDRDARTCQRLRAGRAPAEGLAFSAVRQGLVIGTIRLWHVSAGGVAARKTGELSLPGPFGRDRLLGLELREGALDGAWGMIVPTATAARQSKPRLAARLRKL